MKNFLTAWASSGVKNVIPDTAPASDTGFASYPVGLTTLNATAIAAGGIPVKQGDLNGCLFDITDVLAENSRGNYYKFDAAFAAAIGGYPLGARLVKASGNGMWVNNVAGNSNNPDTGGIGWLAGEPGLLIASTLYATAGSFTFTPSPLTQWLEIQAIGGGGGSSGCAATNASQTFASPAGGAGAYASGRYAKTLSSYSVVVGAAGAAGASGGGTIAGDGGTTTFGSLISCPGGKAVIGAMVSSYPTTVQRSSESSAPTGGNIANTIGRGGDFIAVIAAGQLNGILPARSLFPTRAGEGSAATFNVPSQSAKSGVDGLPGAIYIQEYS